MSRSGIAIMSVWFVVVVFLARDELLKQVKTRIFTIVPNISIFT